MVYLVFCDINTGSLALLLATIAINTFVFVDDGCEKRESAEEAECCSNRTDIVAPGTTPFP